jgi:hypothetical protein
LEAGLATGVLGTDQTIKACHDRLDSLLGAGKQSPDGTLVSNLNADLLDGIHAATSATANKLLALNASAKLPASITGDADTVDGKHASDLDTSIAVYEAHSTTEKNITTRGKEQDLATPQLSVSVEDGDIVVAMFDTHVYGSTTATPAAYLKLYIGSTGGQPRMTASLSYSCVALHFTVTASESATLTVKVVAYLYSGTTSLKTRYDQLVVLRIRP